MEMMIHVDSCANCPFRNGKYCGLSPFTFNEGLFIHNDVRNLTMNLLCPLKNVSIQVVKVNVTYVSGVPAGGKTFSANKI